MEDVPMKKIIAMLLGLALLVAGSALAGDKKKDGAACCEPGGNAAQMKAFYKEVLNGHNIEAVDKYCAESFKDHNPDPGMKGNKQGVKDSFKALFAAFPDLKVEVKQIVEEGDLVVARVIMSGTQKGEFAGMPASGKKFKIQGIDMVKVNKDGKAVERWGNFDNATMFQQLSPKK
jgi:steroid delta-isomerase-like uncharacterized protein